jgi:hypothetical protein
MMLASDLGLRLPDCFVGVPASQLWLELGMVAALSVAVPSLWRRPAPSSSDCLEDHFSRDAEPAVEYRQMVRSV